MSTSKFANYLNIVLPWMHINRNSINFFCILIVSQKVDLKNNVFFLGALQLNISNLDEALVDFDFWQSEIFQGYLSSQCRIK